MSKVHNSRTILPLYGIFSDRSALSTQLDLLHQDEFVACPQSSFATIANKYIHKISAYCTYCTLVLGGRPANQSVFIELTNVLTELGSAIPMYVCTNATKPKTQNRPLNKPQKSFPKSVCDTVNPALLFNKIAADENKMDDTINQLVSMGFEISEAQVAIKACDGNVERAVEYLLNGPAGGGLSSSNGRNGTSESVPLSASAMSSAPGTFISGPISQYNVEHGRSACTCIALTGATNFLNDPSSLSPDFLQRMVQDGVTTYRQIVQTSNAEHMSAEEVLLQDIFPLKLLPDGIQQGIVSNDDVHPLGLKTMLQGCVGRSSQAKNQWTAVVITKTPETVVVMLPPPGEKLFWLLDSHPRPQLHAEHAYAKAHTSLEELDETLKVIFPFADLGPDVPDMMAMMYNAFDLYLLGCGDNHS